MALEITDLENVQNFSQSTLWKLHFLGCLEISNSSIYSQILQGVQHFAWGLTPIVILWIAITILMKEWECTNTCENWFYSLLIILYKYVNLFRPTDLWEFAFESPPENYWTPRISNNRPQNLWAIFIQAVKGRENIPANVFGKLKRKFV